MAKRPRNSTPQISRQRVRQGRGQGSGSGYTPWLFVHDVASRGLSSRVKMFGRVAHFLSGLERQAAYDFLWNPAVVDIREQQNLPLDDTIRIAAEMGVEHPAHRGNLVEVTTDLVVDVESADGRTIEFARSVKPAGHLEVGAATDAGKLKSIRRTLEKLEIERRFYHERGVHWAVLTDRDLSDVRRSNIETMFHKQEEARASGVVTEDKVRRICEALGAADGNRLDDVAVALDAEGTIPKNEFPLLILWMCAERHLVFDIDRPWDLLRPVSDFSFPDAAPALREAA